MAAERARIEAILTDPRAAQAYERWVAAQPSAPDDYLFASARVRFEAAPDDVLVVPGDVRVVAGESGSELRSAMLGGGVAVPGVGRSELERILAAIDGQRTLAELRVLVRIDRKAFERVLERTLGLLSFVPLAVSTLEAALPGTELVRFPGTPYELVRNYWANMASVRRLAEGSLAELGADPVAWLRRLHVVSLMGEELETFYRPQSRITRGGVGPGVLYTTGSEHVKAGETRLLLTGPRVGVGFVGGQAYHRAVAEAAGDPESLLPERRLELDGLDWGSVVTGRARGEEKDVPWFCPPRPIREAHFAALFSALERALAANDAARATEQLARFHYRFVRLHPFRCANQSLAMNLVNLVLTRHGAGIPHLLLDQFALRLTEAAYVRVFELAVAEYAIDAEPRERWRLHREKKTLAYAFVQSLSGPVNFTGARASWHESDAAKRAALVVA